MRTSVWVALPREVSDKLTDTWSEEMTVKVNADQICEKCIFIIVHDLVEEVISVVDVVSKHVMLVVNSLICFRDGGTTGEKANVHTPFRHR